ncbi:DUF2493 domain-containing protein [Lentzea tibetensis]|uniref:DUF2493 domain-containing protein n=1 Tax=Lentzea tibetensis TaxID=2591470 RepID=A0A563EUY3_9PSEU|nr:DUF2493 domain-containing protein [Lentzea tibetensis]TWP51463.1 DUF2493 domain-containing protein [Lentzea tibetensis]
MTGRVLVTGSRDWSDVHRLRRMLAVVRACYPTAVLVHGGCRGADRIAAHIWRGWGLPTEEHQPDWKQHGKAAGPRRNRHMVQLGADVCVAFLHPESRGSVQTAVLAEQAGIQTFRIHHKEVTS